MGSAIGGILGGNGGGLMSAIGGVVGGMFGGPLGAAIGQALGGMLQDVVMDAAKGAIDDLQKESGMPKFLADEVKGKIEEAINSVKGEEASPEAKDIAQDQFGDAMKELKDMMQKFIADAVRDEMAPAETKGKKAAGGKEAASSGSAGSSSTPSAGGWLQAIAKAMGETLGDKAAHMVGLSNDMSELNKKQTSGAEAAASETDAQKKEKMQATNEGLARDFNMKMTEFQATSQEYSMLNNTFSTAIKALGESLSSMARKQ